MRYYLLRAAPFGSDLDFNDGDFVKSFNELANVLGNCLNRNVKMVGRYRAGVLPTPMDDLPQIDRDLLAAPTHCPACSPRPTTGWTCRQCAMLPIELARATNGYIDATEPFKLAKDPAQAGRLDTVLSLAGRAIHQSLVGLLPILPEKAAAGLGQLGVSIQGKTLGELFAVPVKPGDKLGEGQPLFPKVETK